jgi:hypothetical protein
MFGQPLDWTLAGALVLGACLSVPMATLTVKTFPESLLRGVIGNAACLLGGVALVQVF